MNYKVMFLISKEKYDALNNRMETPEVKKRSIDTLNARARRVTPIKLTSDTISHQGNSNENVLTGSNPNLNL